MLEQTREVLAWLNANQETVWPILVGIIALIAVSAILWAWHESPKAMIKDWSFLRFNHFRL